MNGLGTAPDPDLAQLTPIFAALGDPVRLAMVRRLGDAGPLPTAALRPDGVSRQGITKHLRVLEEAGLVESARVGRDRQWGLRPERITAVRSCLDVISASWDARLDRLRRLVERDG